MVNRHLKRWQHDFVALLQQIRHHLVDSDGVGLHLPGGQGVPHGVQQVDNAPVGPEQKKPDLAGESDTWQYTGWFFDWIHPKSSKYQITY